MKAIGLIICCYLLSAGINAQTKFLSRFNLSVTGGMTLPVGAFGKKTLPDDQLSYKVVHENGRYTTYLAGGYSRDSAAFASVGFNYSTELSYNLFGPIKVLFQYSWVNNPVDNEAASNYIQSVGWDEHIQNNYHLRQYGLGLAYQKTIHNNLDLEFGFIAGYGSINYPTFKLRWTPGDQPLTFQPDEDYKPLPDRLQNIGYSVRIGSTYWFSHILGLRVNASYMHYNFKYNMVMRIVPGGSGYVTVDDKLAYRNLLVNAGLVFRLGKEFLRSI